MSDDDRGVVIALVTGPDTATLSRIGRKVVEDGLAACANVLAGVSSIYRWKGEVEQEDEALAILKTTRACARSLERTVRQLHPYEEPEFIVLPVIGGSESYLEWVVGSVLTNPEG